MKTMAYIRQTHGSGFLRWRSWATAPPGRRRPSSSNSWSPSNFTQPVRCKRSGDEYTDIYTHTHHHFPDGGINFWFLMEVNSIRQSKHGTLVCSHYIRDYNSHYSGKTLVQWRRHRFPRSKFQRLTWEFANGIKSLSQNSSVSSSEVTRRFLMNCSAKRIA